MSSTSRSSSVLHVQSLFQVQILVAFLSKSGLTYLAHLATVSTCFQTLSSFSWIFVTKRTEGLNDLDLHLRTYCSIPGFLGTPAGMSTTSAPCKHSCSCFCPRKPQTLARVSMWLRSAATPGVFSISYKFRCEMVGICFKSSARGCPMPPAAPNTATLISFRACSIQTHTTPCRPSTVQK